VSSAGGVGGECWRGLGKTSMTLGSTVLGIGFVALASAFTPVPARAQSDPAELTALAVHINRTPQQSWPGYGIYLGNGLVLTAAHVVGEFAQTKPHVLIAGQDLPAALVKEGTLDTIDLTLLSIDGTKLPIGLQMRRTPLCGHPPFTGESVVVAIPEGTAPSKILPRQAIPADLRGRFDTAIADVATTGNSGSGVFDARDLCLLGIMSRKLSVTTRPLALGGPARTIDVAKYFVPVAQIKAFIPANVSF
jgi:S1-C subfamily serine protease